ncbi:MAG: hypothetical protein Q8P18_33245 [Pseudomonadota bacterium]|nr:hypothetical protein [Pseudomonadota bacterium]
MAAIRLAAFSTGVELYSVTATPNGSLTPLAVGSQAYNLSTGATYSCTALPSTWTAAAYGGTSPWSSSGGVVSLVAAADVTQIGSGGLRPQTDGVSSLGTAALRLFSVVGQHYLCYTAAGDAQESAHLYAGTLELGAGGATATDVKLSRSGVREMKFEGIGGSGSFVVDGNADFRAGEKAAGRSVVAAGATNLTVADNVVGFDATAGNQTPTLPQVGTVRGMRVYIKRIAADVSANTVVVTPTGADTIDGAATQALAARGSVCLYAPPAGTDWWIVA